MYVCNEIGKMCVLVEKMCVLVEIADLCQGLDIADIHGLCK